MNLKDMSKEELLAVINAVNKEIKDRENTRYLELVENACKALNQLKEEFPYTTFEIQVECEECETLLYVDVLSEKEKFTRDDFCD